MVEKKLVAFLRLGWSKKHHQYEMMDFFVFWKNPVCVGLNKLNFKTKEEIFLKENVPFQKKMLFRRKLNNCEMF